LALQRGAGPCGEFDRALLARLRVLFLRPGDRALDQHGAGAQVHVFPLQRDLLARPQAGEERELVEVHARRLLDLRQQHVDLGQRERVRLGLGRLAQLDVLVQRFRSSLALCPYSSTIDRTLAMLLNVFGCWGKAASLAISLR
jgi:hypothetical protein